MRFATDYLTREANKSYRLNGWLIIASLLFLWLQTVTYPPHLVVVWWVGTMLWSWNLVFNTLLLLRILRRRRAARDMLRTMNRQPEDDMDRFLQYSIQNATASAGIPRLKQSCKGWFWTGVLVGSAGATLLIALIQH